MSAPSNATARVATQAIQTTALPRPVAREQAGQLGARLLAREQLTFRDDAAGNNVLGEGSYSVVRPAYSGRMGREVAVKIINKKNASSKFLTKFLPRELKALQQLRHESIVKVFAAFDLSDRVLILMDLCQAGDLLEYVQRNARVQERMAKRMFGQVCNAIEYLHASGMAHRDLKCENILLDANLNAKVTDFGFARPLPTTGDLMCRTSCGSPAYASIEIVKGLPYDACAVDVWALGVVLYVMATGMMPFDDRHPGKHVAQMERGPSFPAVRHQLSRPCQSLIVVMLDPNPLTRPSMPEVVANGWFKVEQQARRVDSERKMAVIDGANRFTSGQFEVITEEKKQTW